MTRPRIRQQYSVDVLGNIRERLTSLAGFPAFCFEMIQNAEDAKSEWIEFQFYDEYLEVRNSSSFSQDDWDRITEIAHGGKPEENIGTFGVGFTSVFQYTDEPSILSSQIKVTISLQRIVENHDQTISDEDATHPPGTTFHIPWAFKDSEVRERIDRPSVSPTQIRSFFDEACQTAPESLVFLRGLKRVILRYGDEESVSIERVDEPCGPSVTKRTVRVTNSRLEESLSTEWLLCRYTPSRNDYPDLGTKRPEVAIAFSQQVRDANSARLYSYLPTQHRTGLPFHIHASFFAKSDRKGIERDGESDHVNWNSLLLQEVPEVYTRMLQSVIGIFGPKAAIPFLPMSYYQSNDFNELNEIVPAIIAAVDDGLPLLYDRNDAQASPDELFLAGNIDATSVDTAESCGARFVNEDFKHLTAWLRKFRVQELNHSDLARLPLLKSLETTATVDEADERFRNPMFRSALYELVSLLLDRDEDSASTLDSISQLHCAVGSRGTVGALNRFWTANDLEHRCFADTYTEDEFWDLEVQATLPNALFQKLPAFSSTDAVAHVSEDNVFGQFFIDEADRLVLLYECVKKWLRHGVSKDERRLLRDARIWSRADGLYVSGRTLDLPNKDFRDPLNLGVVFAHPKGTETSTDELNTARHCLKELGAEPLSFRSYCLKHIPEYVSDHEGEVTTSAVAKYSEVLNVLRSRLRDYQDDEEIKDSLRVLQIVPASDSTFHTPAELYLPSDVLDAVFGSGKYLTPSHTMEEATPSWQEFYEVLGIGVTPRIADVVDRIRELAQEAPSPDRASALQHLFNHLDEYSEDKEDEVVKHARLLRDVACIPSTTGQNDLSKPQLCYISELEALVGKQGPCVAFYFRPRASLRQALGLKDKVPVSVVIANLREHVREQTPVPRRLYGYLNDHSSDPAVRQLHDEACIDIGDGRILAGRQIYFEPTSFGRYRYHLPDKLAEFTDLFEVLGVRHVAAIDPDALVEILQDISSEWSPSNRIPDENTLSVIQYVLVMLSDHLGDEALLSAVAPLRDSKCLPRPDGLLVTPSQLVIKDHQAFAKEFGDRLRTGLIEKRSNTWQLLHNVFGVPMLSEIVEEIHKEPERCVLNQRATQSLLEKRPFVLRIVETLRNTHASGWRTKRLSSLQIYVADPLEVELRLTACAPISVGPKRTPAVYDESENRILVAQGEKYDTAAFARAYASALNPEIELSHIAPLLRVVLEIDDPEMLATELSELGVDLLAEDVEGSEGVQSQEIDTLGIGDTDAPRDQSTPIRNETAGDQDEKGNVESGSASSLATDDSDNSSEKESSIPNQSIVGSSTGVQADPKGEGGAEPTADREPYSSDRVRSDGESAANNAGDITEMDSETFIDHDDSSAEDDLVSNEFMDEFDLHRKRDGYSGPRRGSGSRVGSGRSNKDRRPGTPSGRSDRNAPYESSQNWFRVRASRNRDDNDQRERSDRNTETNDDTRARDVVIAFEKARDWEAVAAPKMQRGFDVVSTNPVTGAKRRIEVKGLSRSWTDDATVRLSRAQFHDALDYEGVADDYWLYVVDRLASDNPRVFVIQNPAKSTYWFYLQAQDWAEDASTAATEVPTLISSETSHSSDQSRDDKAFLRECVPDSLHVVIDSLGDHPTPLTQFEIEHGNSILIVDLAWPTKRFGIVMQQNINSVPDGWVLVACEDIEPSSWAEELDRRLNQGTV
jgi:hypothetical protein